MDLITPSQVELMMKGLNCIFLSFFFTLCPLWFLTSLFIQNKTQWIREKNHFLRPNMLLSRVPFWIILSVWLSDILISWMVCVFYQLPSFFRTVWVTFLFFNGRLFVHFDSNPLNVSCLLFFKLFSSLRTSLIFLRVFYFFEYLISDRTWF